jgi:uncharacterized membrane protein YgcG
VALRRNYRFGVSHEEVFPQGALVVSEVVAATERQSQEDRQRGREPRQRVDEATGLPVFQVTVTDPAAMRSRESAVTVEVLSAQPPELPDPVPNVGIPVRLVEFVGLTAEPRLGGTGEFRYLTYVYRAEGMRAAGGASASASSSGKGAEGRSGSGSDAGSGSGGGRRAGGQ